MILVGYFRDYDAVLNSIRGDLIAEVENLVTDDIDCRKKNIGITHGNAGDMSVATITNHFCSVELKIFSGIGVPFDELNTDDMVAIYEFLFNEVYPDKAVI
jgi:hypothetical protein